MIRAGTAQRTSERGFTLIEMIVALALMGLLLSALAGITGEWLPSWNRGLDRIQRSELIGIALERIGADLAAAEFVAANRDTRKPLLPKVVYCICCSVFRVISGLYQIAGGLDQSLIKA